MIEFKKHQQEPISKKVEVYKASTILFWVLCGVMIIALVVCAVFLSKTQKSFDKDADWVVFLVCLLFLIISSIGFAAFTAFGINFTLLYVHYKKEMLEESKAKNNKKNLV